MTQLPDALRPTWAAPAPVLALMSTRAGGVSPAPFDSLNLRPAALPGSGPLDAPDKVHENQRRFAQALGARPVWLNQVHGAAVHRVTAGAVEAHGPAGGAGPGLPVADASISTEPGLACCVLVADCLPVLLCDRVGRVVGAAHAGWRGLAGGVLENTVQAMVQAAGVAPSEVMAWLGPCIGPQAFEVGADVLAAFGVAAEPGPSGGSGGSGDSGGGQQAALQAAFVYRPRPDGSPRWLANLPSLARERLARAGVHAVTGGQWCTFNTPSRFFSFRREPVTGRLAAAIALRA